MDVAARIKNRGGLATRVALLADGVSSAALSRAVATGQIVRIAPAVYRSGSVHAVDRLRAAASATGGVASHDSAAALWGLELLYAPGLHVTVPRNRSRTKFPDVTIHPNDVTDHAERYTVPATSVLRTVVDCARILPLREAVVVADSALRKGLVTYEQLLSAEVTGRGAARVRKVLSLADPLAGSVLESLLRVLLAVHGLAPPCSQFLIWGEWGAVARVDFAWPQQRLLVEADGFAFHNDRDAYRTDRRKGNAFTSLGWRWLRFSWEDVLHDPEYVVRTVQYELTGRPVRADQ